MSSYLSRLVTAFSDQTIEKEILSQSEIRAGMGIGDTTIYKRLKDKNELSSGDSARDACPTTAKLPRKQATRLEWGRAVVLLLLSQQEKGRKNKQSKATERLSKSKVKYEQAGYFYHPACPHTGGFAEENRVYYS